WPANASKYDVDVVTGDTTGDAFKSTKAREWLQNLLGDATTDYPNSISIRRLMLTLYRGEYNASLKAIKTLVSVIPKGWPPGAGAAPLDFVKLLGAGTKLDGALAAEAIAASILSA